MKLRSVFLAPGAAVMLVLFVCPLMITAAYSLLSRGPFGGVTGPWTLESYARWADPLYLTILGRSVALAAVATALCLVAGMPLALFIAQSQRRRLWLSLVMLPFWTSLLIRLYAWMFLLRDTGLINSVLLALGWIQEPLPLLYNDQAVVVGLVYGSLPFAVLPIYAALERLDPALLEAAADLGATPWSAFWRVTTPLAAPGLRAAALLTFIPCLGQYLTPDLLGGGKSILIGNVIQNQFTTARDWPFGAALSLVLMSGLLAALLLLPRQDREELL